MNEDKVELAQQQFQNALKHDPSNESAIYHMITVSAIQNIRLDLSDHGQLEFSRGQLKIPEATQGKAVQVGDDLYGER